MFWDPSVLGGGPSSLLADNTAILEALKSLGYSMIWSMVGEKRMLGSYDYKDVRRVRFSQVGQLDSNGSIDVGELTLSA